MKSLKESAAGEASTAAEAQGKVAELESTVQELQANSVENRTALARAQSDVKSLKESAAGEASTAATNKRKLAEMQSKLVEAEVQLGKSVAQGDTAAEEHDSALAAMRHHKEAAEHFVQVVAKESEGHKQSYTAAAKQRDRIMAKLQQVECVSSNLDDARKSIVDSDMPYFQKLYTLAQSGMTGDAISQAMSVEQLWEEQHHVAVFQEALAAQSREAASKGAEAEAKEMLQKAVGEAMALRVDLKDKRQESALAFKSLQSLGMEVEAKGREVGDLTSQCAATNERAEKQFAEHQKVIDQLEIRLASLEDGDCSLRTSLCEAQTELEEARREHLKVVDDGHRKLQAKQTEMCETQCQLDELNKLHSEALETNLEQLQQVQS